MIGRKPRLTLIPALALTLTGCGIDGSEPPDDGPDYVSVCEDRSGTRVDDSQCQPDGYSSASSSFVWFYMPTTGGVSAPPVGHKINRSTGTYRPPPAMPGGRVPSVARGGSVPNTGGVVQRGGLGASGGKAGSAGS